MKTLFLKASLVLPVLLGLIFLTTSVFAAITVDPRKGTLSVKTPDGKVTIYEEDDELPEIPDGSTLEVISGDVTISVTESSAVDVIVNSSTVTLNGGDSIFLATILGRQGETTQMIVDQGTIDITPQDGSTTTASADNVPQDLTSSSGGTAVNSVQYDPQDPVPGVDPAGTGGVGRNEAVQEETTATLGAGY